MTINFYSFAAGVQKNVTAPLETLDLIPMSIPVLFSPEDVVHRFNVRMGSAFALGWGVTVPSKARRRNVLTLHGPFRKVGAGEALADVPGD